MFVSYMFFIEYINLMMVNLFLKDILLLYEFFIKISLSDLYIFF